MAKKPAARWTPEERQAFADRAFLKAKTVPCKKREASRMACRRGRRGWD
jgi:hypothetical protein